MHQDENILINGDDTAKEYVLFMIPHLLNDLNKDRNRKDRFHLDYCVVKSSDLIIRIQNENQLNKDEVPTA